VTVILQRFSFMASLLLNFRSYLGTLPPLRQHPRTSAFQRSSYVVSTTRNFVADSLGAGSSASLEPLIPPSVLDPLNEYAFDSLYACDVASRVSRKRTRRVGMHAAIMVTVPSVMSQLKSGISLS
jgi:hypothetical protein